MDLVIGGVAVPARIWQGETDSGTPVHCYITRVAVDESGMSEQTKAGYRAQFERELAECAAPRPGLEAIPFRLIL